MGVTVCVLIADRRLDDEQLAALSLFPRGGQVRGDDVMLTPADRRACVVRTDASTIVVDGGDALAGAIDDERIDLPGTLHIASVASSAGFCDFLVMTDGDVVRRLQQGEGETLIDEGDALPSERDIVFSVDGDDDGGDGDGGDGDDGGDEIDGDVLIERLPAIAGLSDDVDIFALVGECFGSTSAGGPGDDASGSAAAPTASVERRTSGFFSRLFGR